jgi:hypothetical protein
MLLRLIIAAVSFVALFGCAGPKVIVSKEESFIGKGKDGSWTNIYRGDPNLTGVITQQFPDGDDNFTFEERDGKHPCMILYGFWDDRFRQIHYTPTGDVVNEFWFKIDESTKWIWDGVDFTQGADPSFERHQDPRVKWAKSTKPTAEQDATSNGG